MSITPTKRPTIRDVAGAANVSKSLVSLVLSNSPKVSDEKRARVWRAVEELGFEMNIAARSLASHSTPTIGVLVSDLHNPWAFDVADAARAIIEDSEYGVLFGAMSSPRSKTEIDMSLLQTYRDLRVTGLLVVGSIPHIPELGRLVGGCPLAFAGSGDEYAGSADVINSDDDAGVAMVVQHLASQGHRRIMHLGGLGGSVARRRADAYLKAMAEHGLAQYAQIFEADYTIESGERAARAALAGKPKENPTAMVCVNDLAALGAMSVADELGAHVAITGYDNITVAHIPRLSLTSVDPDVRELGEQAAEALISRIGDSSREFLDVRIAPELMVRNSSRNVRVKK